MNTAKPLRPETLSIHAGSAPDPVTGARIPPVHQAVSYVFQNAEQAANLFHLKETGNIYGRLTNPTTAALEEKLAALEGGVGAVCTASGLASHILALSALMQSGDHVIASDMIYGGTYNQFKNVFPHSFGWGASFADHTRPESFKAALKPNTKAIFIESLANPAGAIPDLQAIAAVAREAGIPLIVDNTMATPALCQPFKFGANIVTHSTTKFLNGHCNAMGGAVIDGGNFDWRAQGDKFPLLTQIQPTYGEKSLCDAFGNKAFTVHNRTGLRDLGIGQQPMNAWLTLVGMETLFLRMQRHCDNAQTVAEYLLKHAKVGWVSYSGLPASPYQPMARKYMNGKGGAVFTFGIKGGYAAGVKFVESLKLFSHVAHIGDTRSMVIHPASTTHSQLTPDARKAGGVGDDVVRLSIGIEHIDDIIDDVEQALAST